MAFFRGHTLYRGQVSTYDITPGTFFRGQVSTYDIIPGKLIPHPPLVSTFNITPENDYFSTLFPWKHLPNLNLNY